MCYRVKKLGYRVNYKYYRYLLLANNIITKTGILIRRKFHTIIQKYELPNLHLNNVPFFLKKNRDYL